MKNHQFKRTGNYIRYIVHPNPELDTRYDYEATDEDIEFLNKINGPKLTIEEFERLINLFEKENYNAGNRISIFPSFVWKAEKDIISKNEEGTAKIYNYWNQTRSNRVNKSLMRKYWRPPDPSNTDLRITFRSCKDEKHNLRRNRKYDEDYLRKVVLHNF